MEGDRVKNSHPLYIKYNQLILAKLQDVEKRIIEAQINDVEINKEYLFSKNNEGQLLLTLAVEQYIKKLKDEKKFTSAEKSHNLIKKITDFSPGATINQVDVDWMKKFNQYLRSFNSFNTASKNSNSLITILRYFYKKGLYSKGETLSLTFRYNPTTKNKLSKEELFKLMDLDLSKDSALDIVRDSFCLAFYLRGMRIGDVLTLQWKEIVGDRVVRANSRKTDKPINIKLLPQALNIIYKYKGDNPIYVLPFLKMPPERTDRFRKHIEAKTAVINYKLKVLGAMIETDKNLTTHVARHTFAYLADQQGMTAKRIQDFLNHSDLKTTQNYIEDLNKNDVLDKEMDNFMNDLFS